MNAIGWILIIFLGLIILTGVGLLIYYLTKKKSDSSKGGSSDPNTGSTQLRNLNAEGSGGLPSSPEPISIVVKQGELTKSYLGMTTGADSAVGITVINTTSVCPEYKWNYTGPNGSLEASWISSPTRFIGVDSIANPPANNDNIILLGTADSPLDPAKTQWMYINQNKSWCLTKNPSLCMHYNITELGVFSSVNPQNLTIKTFNKNDKGFIFNNLLPLSTETTPSCGAT